MGTKSLIFALLSNYIIMFYLLYITINNYFNKASIFNDAINK